MSLFRMPSLGADMEAATLVEWLVKPGDHVRRGDIVAVVETQKGAIEIEIFEEGEVGRLLVSLGETVPVGTPLAEIAGSGEAPAERRAAAQDLPAEARAPASPAPPGIPEPAAPEPAGAARAPVAETRRAVGEPATAEPAAGAMAAARLARPDAAAGGAAAAGLAADGVVPASPAARLRAREAGLDLAPVRGTGPGGAVLLADVEAAAARGADPEAAGRGGPGAATGRFDPAAMRAAVAAAMARSKREIPHYYLAHEIDLEAAGAWLAEVNAGRPPEARLVLGLLLVRAAARAARAVPEVNGHHVDGAFRHSDRVHAGVAVALRGGGLVAPALHDADERPLDDLMAGMRDLVARARTGRLRSSEMTDATLTVSSLGERGVDAMQGVIFPPQVALVGFGTPSRRPAVVGERVEPRLRVTASLAADHRVGDGRTGARYLKALAGFLEKPEDP